jgi:hypothetical protein
MSVQETNRAQEMALHHAVLILQDLKGLTNNGQQIMTDTLMDLIMNDEK